MTAEKSLNLNEIARLATRIAAGYEEYHLSTEEELESLVVSLRNLLMGTEEEVEIATGKLAHELYNHPQIIDTLTQLSQKGVKITVIHSEVFPQHKGDPKTTEITGLAKEGVLEMYSSSDEILFDFWLIDRSKVLSEDTPFLGKDFVLHTQSSDSLGETCQGRFDFLKINAQLDQI